MTMSASLDNGSKWKPVHLAPLGTTRCGPAPATSGRRFFADILKPILLGATGARQARVTPHDDSVPDSKRGSGENMEWCPSPSSESTSDQTHAPDDSESPEGSHIAKDAQKSRTFFLPVEPGRPKSKDTRPRSVRKVRRRMSPVLRVGGIKRPERKAAIEDTGDHLKLPTLTPQAPANLSGGPKESKSDISFDTQRVRKPALIAQHTILPGSNLDQEIFDAADNALPSVAARCVDCGAKFGNVCQSNHCGACGGVRIDDQIFDQAFNMFAMSQTSMRKAALPQFMAQIQHLLKSSPYLSKKSSREQVSCVISAFNITVERQKNSDCKVAHGIAVEFFPDFLFLVAEGLNMTCRILLHGLLCIESFPAKRAEDSFSQCEARRVVLPELGACERIGLACTHCGCFTITKSDICCNCGQKTSIHKEQYLQEMADTYNMLPSQITEIKKIFDQFDEDQSGFLGESGFFQAVLHLAHADVCHSTLKRWWKQVGFKEEGITFDIFLSWYAQNWSNEMLIC